MGASPDHTCIKGRLGASDLKAGSLQYTIRRFILLIEGHPLVIGGRLERSNERSEHPFFLGWQSTPRPGAVRLCIGVTKVDRRSIRAIFGTQFIQGTVVEVVGPFQAPLFCQCSVTSCSTESFVLRHRNGVGGDLEVTLDEDTENTTDLTISGDADVTDRQAALIRLYSVVVIQLGLHFVCSCLCDITRDLSP